MGRVALPQVEEQRCIVSGGGHERKRSVERKKQFERDCRSYSETDSGIQIQTLQLFRRKIEQYQYTPSLSFELFRMRRCSHELGRNAGFEELNDRTMSFVILHDAQTNRFYALGKKHKPIQRGNVVLRKRN